MLSSVSKNSSALGLLLSCLLLGILTNNMAWSLLLGLSIWTFLQSKEFAKVRRWSQRPLQRPENGHDNWFSIADTPYQALQRQRQRTQVIAGQLRNALRLAEFIPDGIIVLGPDGVIQGINQAAKKMMSLHGSNIGLGLVTVVRQPNFIDFLNEQDDEKILEFVSPLDPIRTLEARKFHVDEDASIVLIRDITTLNQLLTMRQSFVANVSHELRTPLAVVQGYMETLTDPDEEADLRIDLIARLVAPIDRMCSLVDDLTTLTQLESGSLTPALNTVDLTRVVHGALAELGGVDSLQCEVVLGLANNATVAGVETELYSVCVNLISNAIRHGADGGTIKIVSEIADGWVRLSVTDNGGGIAPEHLDRLTERFYRVDLAGARATGGTGLGLAIVKHVLRRHDATLEITSTLGSGSTFAFELAHESQATLQTPTEKQADGTTTNS
jgi:two-component system, OmpR family, phosphate regulon sensor histidine kinase PhoR